MGIPRRSPPTFGAPPRPVDGSRDSPRRSSAYSWAAGCGTQPKKSRGSQRLYVRRDIEQILEIKRMLYDEGYTIAGLKRFWARRYRHSMKPVRPRDVVERVRGELHAILKVMDSYDR